MPTKQEFKNLERRFTQFQQEVTFLTQAVNVLTTSYEHSVPTNTLDRKYAIDRIKVAHRETMDAFITLLQEVDNLTSINEEQAALEVNTYEYLSKDDYPSITETSGSEV